MKKDAGRRRWETFFSPMPLHDIDITTASKNVGKRPKQISNEIQCDNQNQLGQSQEDYDEMPYLDVGFGQFSQQCSEYVNSTISASIMAAESQNLTQQYPPSSVNDGQGSSSSFPLCMNVNTSAQSTVAHVQSGLHENEVGSNSSGRSTFSDFSTSPSSWVGEIDHASRY